MRYTQDSNDSLSYKDAGVDINAGNDLVNNIKADVVKTHRPEVMGNIGGFGAMCAIPTKYKEPILVSGTDGVGTKLRLAIDLNRNETIGQDLVAMCVNDLIVQGAEPLFFLDYFATGKLEVAQATTVIRGISNACAMSGCALIGGETAEMPGMYHAKDYDLAGFCVGVVERADIIDGSKVKRGDTLIALGSSGAHSNGYSLIRKVIEKSGVDLASFKLGDKLLADLLLAPTKIYVKSILNLIKQVPVSSIVHITGGGFWENIPRVLPSNVKAVIDKNSWQWQELFNWLQQEGNITDHEMLRTFNCGVGMIVALPQDQVELALDILHENGENAWVIGHLELLGEGTEQVEVA